MTEPLDLIHIQPLIRHLNRAQELYGKLPDVDMLLNMEDYPEYFQDKEVYKDWRGGLIPPMFGHCMVDNYRQLDLI